MSILKLANKVSDWWNIFDFFSCKGHIYFHLFHLIKLNSTSFCQKFFHSYVIRNFDWVFLYISRWGLFLSVTLSYIIWSLLDFDFFNLFNWFLILININLLFFIIDYKVSWIFFLFWRCLRCLLFLFFLHLFFFFKIFIKIDSFKITSLIVVSVCDGCSHFFTCWRRSSFDFIYDLRCSDFLYSRFNFVNNLRTSNFTFNWLYNIWIPNFVNSSGYLCFHIIWYYLFLSFFCFIKNWKHSRLQCCWNPLACIFEFLNIILHLLILLYLFLFQF